MIRKILVIPLVFLLAMIFRLENAFADSYVECKYSAEGFELILQFDGENSPAIYQIYNGENIDVGDEIKYLYNVKINYSSSCPEHLYYVAPRNSIVGVTYDKLYGYNQTDKINDECGTTTKSNDKCIVRRMDLIKVSNKLSCGQGKGMVTGIPRQIPRIISQAITILQIIVPVILVIVGSIDFFKGMASTKEDEIKKGQKIFAKRIIIAVVIFLVVIAVKFLVSVVSDTNVSNIVSCIDCFISNKCDGNGV